MRKRKSEAAGKGRKEEGSEGVSDGGGGNDIEE